MTTRIITIMNGAAGAIMQNILAARIISDTIDKGEVAHPIFSPPTETGTGSNFVSYATATLHTMGMYITAKENTTLPTLYPGGLREGDVLIKSLLTPAEWQGLRGCLTKYHLIRLSDVIRTSPYVGFKGWAALAHRSGDPIKQTLAPPYEYKELQRLLANHVVTNRETLKGWEPIVSPKQAKPYHQKAKARLRTILPTGVDNQEAKTGPAGHVHSDGSYYTLEGAKVAGFAIVSVNTGDDPLTKEGDPERDNYYTQGGASRHAASSYSAELCGILMGVIMDNDVHQVEHYLDNLAAKLALASFTRLSFGQQIKRRNHGLLRAITARIKEREWAYNIHWVKGHDGYTYNEIADEVAKEAAEKGSTNSRFDRYIETHEPLYWVGAVTYTIEDTGPHMGLTRAWTARERPQPLGSIKEFVQTIADTEASTAAGMSSQRHATIPKWAWERVDHKTLKNGLTGRIHSCLDRYLDSHFARAFLQIHNSLYQILKTRPEERAERLLHGMNEPETLTADTLSEHFDMTCPLCPRQLSESEAMNSTEHLLWHCENTQICGVREKTQQDITNSLASIGPVGWWEKARTSEESTQETTITMDFLNEYAGLIRPAPAKMEPEVWKLIHSEGTDYAHPARFTTTRQLNLLLPHLARGAQHRADRLYDIITSAPKLQGLAAPILDCIVDAAKIDQERMGHPLNLSSAAAHTFLHASQLYTDTKEEGNTLTLIPKGGRHAIEQLVSTTSTYAQVAVVDEADTPRKLAEKHWRTLHTFPPGTAPLAHTYATQLNHPFCRSLSTLNAATIHIVGNDLVTEEMERDMKEQIEEVNNHLGLGPAVWGAEHNIIQEALFEGKRHRGSKGLFTLRKIFKTARHLNHRGLPSSQWKKLLKGLKIPPQDQQAWLDTIALLHIQQIAALQRKQGKLIPKVEAKPKESAQEGEKEPKEPIPRNPALLPHQCEGRCRGYPIDLFCDKDPGFCQRKCGHRHNSHTVACKVCGGCQADLEKIMGSKQGQTALRDVQNSHCECKHYRAKKLEVIGRFTRRVRHPHPPKARGRVQTNHREQEPQENPLEKTVWEEKQGNEFKYAKLSRVFVDPLTKEDRSYQGEVTSYRHRPQPNWSVRFGDGEVLKFNRKELLQGINYHAGLHQSIEKVGDPIKTLARDHTSCFFPAAAPIRTRNLVSIPSITGTAFPTYSGTRGAALAPVRKLAQMPDDERWPEQDTEPEDRAEMPSDTQLDEATQDTTPAGRSVRHPINPELTQPTLAQIWDQHPKKKRAAINKIAAIRRKVKKRTTTRELRQKWKKTKGPPPLEKSARTTPFQAFIANPETAKRTQPTWVAIPRAKLVRTKRTAENDEKATEPGHPNSRRRFNPRLSTEAPAARLPPAKKDLMDEEKDLLSPLELRAHQKAQTKTARTVAAPPHQAPPNRPQHQALDREVGRIDIGRPRSPHRSPPRKKTKQSKGPQSPSAGIMVGLLRRASKPTSAPD